MTLRLLVTPQEMYSQRVIFYIVFHPQTQQKIYIFHNLLFTYKLKPLFFCYL